MVRDIRQQETGCLHSLLCWAAIRIRRTPLKHAFQELFFSGWMPFQVFSVLPAFLAFHSFPQPGATSLSFVLFSGASSPAIKRGYRVKLLDRGPGQESFETGVLIVASGHQDPHSSLLCWPQEIGRCGAGCAQIDAGRGRRVAPSCVGVLGDCCVAVVSQACCAFPALAQIRKFQSGYVLAGCCVKNQVSAPRESASRSAQECLKRAHISTYSNLPR